jgi:hypothetical protein
VARFLSPDWIAGFNAALRGAPLPDLKTGSTRAATGRWRVEQAISGVPGRPPEDGPLRLVLSVEPGHVSLSTAAPHEEPADVVISLGYEDAAALSRGELDPAEALAAGRVRVRGDLSVLVAGQALLAAAAAHLAALQGETCF